jgi:hypothetical protein
MSPPDPRTTHPDEPRPGQPVEPEEDVLPYGKLALVSALALAAFTVGGLWSTWILLRPSHTLHPELRDPLPAQVGKPEIGMVDQRMFPLERQAEVKRAEHQRRLTSYGWVNREAKVIHIPIEQAMDELAKEKP